MVWADMLVVCVDLVVAHAGSALLRSRRDSAEEIHQAADFRAKGRNDGRSVEGGSSGSCLDELHIAVDPDSHSNVQMVPLGGDYQTDSMEDSCLGAPAFLRPDRCCVEHMEG
jgi:hypothetical protein